jgi:DnaK suppressor protein
MSINSICPTARRFGSTSASPTLMPINDRDVFRRALKQKEAELAALLRRREEIAVEQVPDAFDLVQITTERELAITTLQRETDLLRQVRKALKRIEDRTYGMCQRCDEEISIKRLLAVPWTAYCIRCQADIDAEHGPRQSTPAPDEVFEF